MVIIVSVLNREPMWLKFVATPPTQAPGATVSVLNREPMWLKYMRLRAARTSLSSFSAQP